MKSFGVIARLHSRSTEYVGRSSLPKTLMVSPNRRPTSASLASPAGNGDPVMAWRAGDGTGSPFRLRARNSPLGSGYGVDRLMRDRGRSKRSAFITLFHAATKSVTNFACASAEP